ncbi:MAG: DUF4135 domain-containing protein, partial [Eubacteriales bacterium]|nr:DUF4135 domain-containing protein [Eubacteriales bacterium]
ERVFREADRQTAAEQGDAPAGMYRREFPLLGGYEQTILADFISAQEEFFENFLKHRDRVSQVLFDGREIHVIEGFTGMDGDVHRRGRAVCGVRTDAGTFYYKPHDCSLESLYGELVERFFADCTGAARCVEGEGCGFVSEIESRPLGSPEKIHVYYRNMGKLMALFYGVGGNDMHCENMLPCGEKPCAVDLETLFRPMAGPAGRTGAGSKIQDPVMEDFRHTAGSTGMLPCIIGGMSIYSPMYESNIGDDYLPFAGDRHYSAHGCEEDVIAGFEEGYRRLMEKKDAVKAVLVSHKRARIRYIRWNTVFYIILQAQLYNAKNMQSEEARDEVLSRLEVPSRLSENFADPVITGYEAACLCRGDIPYFCTEFDGCSLCGGETDEIIRPKYFRRSAGEMAFDFLDSLSEADLLFEKGLIREHLSGVPCREEKDTEVIPVGDESATEESILQLCAGLADTVTASRLRTTSGYSVWWSQLHAVYRRPFFHAACTSASVGQAFALFERLGIFMDGTLAERIHNQTEVIEKSISVWDQVEADRLRREMCLSFDFGLACVVTACEIMASSGVRAAEACFQHLIRFLVEKELHLCPSRDDLIELLAALCMAEMNAPEKDAFARDAFRNLQGMPGLQDGLSVNHLAALAMSAARLYESCGDSLYEEKAAEYLDGIRARYDGSKKGWADEEARIPWLAPRGPQAAWIAVCMMKIMDRTRSAPCLQKAREILALSLQSLMDERTLRYNDSLFHGNALSVTALTMASQHLSDRRLHDHAGRILSSMQARYRKKGAFTICPEGVHDIFDAGFIRGTMGIGSAAAYWFISKP